MLEFISHDIQCHSSSWLHLVKTEYPVSIFVDRLPFLVSDPILQNLVLWNLPSRCLLSGPLFVGSLLDVNNVLDFTSINGAGWWYLLAGWQFLLRLQLLNLVWRVEGDLVAFNFPASVVIIMSVVDAFVGLNCVLGKASCLYGNRWEHLHVGGCATGPPDLVRWVTLLN